MKQVSTGRRIPSKAQVQQVPKAKESENYHRGLPINEFLWVALVLLAISQIVNAKSALLVVTNKSKPDVSGLNTTQLDMVGEAIRGQAAEMLDSRGVQVMTEENTIALLDQLGVDPSQCEGECDVTTARNMKADWLITSKVVPFGSQFTLSLNMIHTESARVVCSETVNAQRVEEVTEIAKEATRLLCQRSGLVEPSQNQARGESVQNQWQPSSGVGVLVTFESQPPGALLTVNGRYIGECPITEELSTGLHDVEWSLNYYETERRVVRVDKRGTVNATLKPVFSQISVTTEPSKMPVWVDARYLGESPLERITLGHGEHRMVVGDSSWTVVQERRVTLEKGQHHTFHVDVPIRQGQLVVRAYDQWNNAVEAPVFVQDVPVGNTPLDILIPIGDYTVTVMEQEREVRIREKQSTVLRFSEYGETEGNEEPLLEASAFYRMRFIKVEAGHFTMGSPESEMDRESDEIAHEVDLSAFEIQSTEVTQEMWEAVMDNNPSVFKGAQRPVENVSWNHVQIFLARLNAMEPGMGYRLPTEAEWEYACRSYGTAPWASGRSAALISEHAWFRATAEAKTHDVGTRMCNALGLSDMMGNVWEWCSDWYDVYDTRSPRNPQGGMEGDRRVIRGGAWNSAPSALRSANRSSNRPDLGNSSLGFRLCRKPQ